MTNAAALPAPVHHMATPPHTLPIQFTELAGRREIFLVYESHRKRLAVHTMAWDDKAVNFNNRFFVA
ncbi:hypothetical protein SK128_019686 [Halocaridina rubra]|uniref:Uncharacterized protein n=1 Tax=Halocaridina rubra TaxID=373956 RepID=A0AAN9A3U9_HALRR